MGLNDLKRQQPQRQMNPMELARQLQSNAGGIFQKCKMQVPENLNGNAGGIIEHLLKTGQITQDSLLEARKMASKLMGTR